MAMIPVAVGVGWAVSPVINMVISKTQTYLENRFFEKAGVEEEMKKVKTTLRNILLIMSAVEKQKIVDPNHVELVQEVKDAVYDAEDLLDEFEYNLLDAKSSESEKTVVKVLSSTISEFWSLVGNAKFKERVKKITERLDRTKESAETLRLNMSFNSDLQYHEKENWALTSSIISEEIVGRKRECEHLIQLVKQQAGGPHTVIPIIGQGGIGKTTLAQMVFNDKRIINHFDLKMWFNVSENFDVLRLTREMVKCVCENFSTVDASFDKLQRKLETELDSKTLLVVFDDVWYDHTDNNYGYEQKWLKMLAPLKKSMSKVILTTRECVVGDILGSMDSLSLGELSDMDSWSLFKMCAFSSENSNRYTELEPIGKRMVKELKKATLAIKSVGAILRHNSDVKEWRKMLTEISACTNDVMNILLRSYQYLPEPLQRCFAYCSLFPKGYRLKRDRLIYMWIANGFIVPHKTKSVEDVAKSYFNELISRSFIQKIKNGNKHHYVVHDLMADMACQVSRGDCHIFKNGDSMKNVSLERHLSVTDPQAINSLMNLDGLEKLRTLMFVDDKLLNEEVLNKLLIKLKTVRVLDIEWKASDFICECKHLRYLSFRMIPGTSRLPFSKKVVCHQLSALFLRKSSVLRGLGYTDSLPLSDSSMSSSTIVDVSKLIRVQVGGLTQVHRNLRGPACLHVRKEKRHGLDQLEHMNNIKGSLEITGLENAASWEEAINAQLRNKEHVSELSLAWEHYNDLPRQNSSSSIDSRNHELLEALSPNLTIEKLKIKGYGGAAWPSWLESNSLSAIKSIELSYCKRTEMLPALGQLPLLQKLLIIELSAVRRIGPEFYGSGTFPSIEYLEIDGLPCLREWFCPCDVSVFPKLHTLHIRNCPLFTISELNEFSALQCLQSGTTVSNNQIEAAFQGDISLLSLTKLEIASCHGLVRLEGLHELVSLQILFIHHCQDLSSFPEMEFLYSLKLLEIYNCPKLRSLPRKGLPVSLQLLIIGGTIHDSLEEQIRNKKGCEWDKVAAISGCQLFASFIKQWEDDKYDFGGSARRLFQDYEYPIGDQYNYWRILDGIKNFKVNKDVDAHHSA